MIGKDVTESPILHRCFKPQRIMDRRGIIRYVPCGHCPACLNYRSWRLSRRCVMESNNPNSMYPVFVTFTYCDKFLPLFIRRQLIDKETGEVYPSKCYINYSTGDIINVAEMDMDNLPYAPENYDITKLPFDYVENPVADCFSSFNVQDLQLCFKRLRRRISYHLKVKKDAFRYFVVAEYGEKRHRPHYHAILWCKTREVQKFILAEFDSNGLPPAVRLERGLRSSWSYGITDASVPHSAAGTCKYIAGYINSLSMLGYNFNLRQIRPFYLSSRNHLIGYSENEQHSFEYMQEAYFRKDISRVSPIYSCKSSNGVSISNVLYSTSIRYKFVPKCTAFDRWSFAERVNKYSLLVDVLQESGVIERCYNYSKQKHFYKLNVDNLDTIIKLYCKANRIKAFNPLTQTDEVYYKDTRNYFCRVSFDVSRVSVLDMHCARVCLDFCLKYGLTPDDYVKFVTDYYTACASFQMSQQCVQYSYLYDRTGNNNYLIYSDLVLRDAILHPRNDTYPFALDICKLNNITVLGPKSQRKLLSKVLSPYLFSQMNLYYEQEWNYAYIHAKERYSHEHFNTVCW